MTTGVGRDAPHRVSIDVSELTREKIMDTCGGSGAKCR